MLDTTKEVEVPEGVVLSLPIAGYPSRSLAYLIDFLIRMAFILIASTILSVFGKMGGGLFYLAVFLIEWFYPVLFEVFNHGQTPGKKILGILVINDDGTPINWSSSIVRNLLRFADMLPMFYAFGILTMLMNREFKRLGDFAAGTLVIHQQAITSNKQQYNVTGSAPKTPLSLDEQSAIISFAERTPEMSQARANELAGHLSPWLNRETAQLNKESYVTQLIRIAKWLRG